MAEMLVFDNVRPARLTLDDLLAGGLGVVLFADDVPALAPLRAVTDCEDVPPAA